MDRDRDPFPPRQPEPLYFALDSLPHMVWIAGPDGALEYMNRRGLDFIGLPLDDMLGWDWGWVIHPADLPHTLDVWNKSLLAGAPHEVQFRIRRHDGVYRWHMAHGLPARDPDGHILRWYGTCTDIDEAKRTEAALRATQGLFRALVERSDRGFALLGPDRIIRYVSPVVAAISGFQPDEVIGRDAWEFAHADDRASLTSYLEHLLSRPGEWTNFASRFLHRNGSFLPIEMRAINLMPDPDVRAVAAHFWPGAEADDGGLPPARDLF